jgi:hypothetical protein
LLNSERTGVREGWGNTMAANGWMAGCPLEKQIWNVEANFTIDMLILKHH